MMIIIAILLALILFAICPDLVILIIYFSGAIILTAVMCFVAIIALDQLL